MFLRLFFYARSGKTIIDCFSRAPVEVIVEGRSNWYRAGWRWQRIGGWDRDVQGYSSYSISFECVGDFPRAPGLINESVARNAALDYSTFTNQSLWFRIEEGVFLQAACYRACSLCVLKRGEEIEHMPQQPPLNSTGMDCTLTDSMQTVSRSGCQETASCELLMLANTAAVGIELSSLEMFDV